jgi:hypothetical protein
MTFQTTQFEVIPFKVIQFEVNLAFKPTLEGKSDVGFRQLENDQKWEC